MIYKKILLYEKETLVTFNKITAITDYFSSFELNIIKKFALDSINHPFIDRLFSGGIFSVMMNRKHLIAALNSKLYDSSIRSLHIDINNICPLH